MPSPSRRLRLLALPCAAVFAAAALATCSDGIRTTGQGPGGFCFDDVDCERGLTCIANICEAVPDGGTPCTPGSCPADQVCVDGQCVTRPPDMPDVDGDGVEAPDDCDDEDRTRRPGATELCDGEDNDCDTLIDEHCPPCRAGDTQFCGLALGRCSQGTQTCEDARWSACSAEGPSRELCDDADNDCDGATDEGCPCTEGASRPCGTDEGACDRGVQACASEVWGACQGAGPGEERCDEADNDCDGQTDEGFALGLTCSAEGDCGEGVRLCRPVALREPDESGAVPPDWICSTDPLLLGGEVPDERCDGRDNNCDGQIDEGYEVGVACTGRGECGQGVLECDDDGESRCSTNPGGSQDRAGPEDCDGRDDNCDGSTDEAFRVGEPCDGEGECGAGLFECAAIDAARCNTDPGGTAHVRVLETCDDLDNDCDGATDNGFKIAEACVGRGECGGGVFECLDEDTAVCSSNPEGSASRAVPEVCDGLDNDCDGLTDEDFLVGEPCEGVGECGEGLIQCLDERRSVCSSDPGGTADQSLPELCDDLDNDCDGRFDEDFRVGEECVGIGACGRGAFECRSVSSSDCDTNPGGRFDQSQREICDAIDNDCDALTDEDWQIGQPCDGVGACGPSSRGRGWECDGLFDRVCSTDVGGSEDQSTLELCNGIDDNCDTNTDEGADEALCTPRPAHADVRCNRIAGRCEIDDCDRNWFDLDGVVATGCECSGDTYEDGGGAQCNDAADLGGLDDDQRHRVLVNGNLVAAPGEVDVDWYTFTALDDDPQQDEPCDVWFPRIVFTANPRDQFQFDVLRGCDLGGDLLHRDCTDFSDSRNYIARDPRYQGGDVGALIGQCECRAATNADAADPRAICRNDTTRFYMRVFRRPGLHQTCEGYTIEFSNGRYTGGPHPPFGQR